MTCEIILAKEDTVNFIRYDAEVSQVVNPVDNPATIYLSGGQGPQGPQGLQGPQGIQGNTGAQGEQGIPGPNSIGGFGFSFDGLQQGDLLQLGASAWVNTPQIKITDGGNF